MGVSVEVHLSGVQPTEPSVYMYGTTLLSADMLSAAPLFQYPLINSGARCADGLLLRCPVAGGQCLTPGCLYCIGMPSFSRYQMSGIPLDFSSAAVVTLCPGFT